MERLTGVVMEITDRRVVVITPKGEFKQVRIHGRTPDIGEEISIPVGHRRFFNKPIATWAAVAAAVIFLVVGGPLLSMVNQIDSGVSLSEKDKIQKPFSEVISKAGGAPDQNIGKARQGQQFENKEQQYQLAATGETGTEEAVISAGAGQDQFSQPADNSEPATDTGKPAADTDKERYIEPIRREGDPEVRSKPSDTKDSQAAAAQKPAAQPVENPAGEPTEDPAGEVVAPDTDENYMGPETGSGSENSDMYILKPHF